MCCNSTWGKQFVLASQELLNGTLAFGPVVASVRLLLEVTTSHRENRTLLDFFIGFGVFFFIYGTLKFMDLLIMLCGYRFLWKQQEIGEAFSYTVYMSVFVDTDVGSKIQIISEVSRPLA